MLRDLTRRVCLPSGNMTFEQFMYERFVMLFGAPAAAAVHLAAMKESCEKYREQSRRVALFSRVLGLHDALPLAGVLLLLKALNRVHARAGPLFGEVTDGASEVPVITYLRIVDELLAGRRVRKYAVLLRGR